MDGATFGVDVVPVRDLGLRDAEDEAIFAAARAADAVLLTKDRDFPEMVRRLGPPPPTARALDGTRVRLAGQPARGQALVDVGRVRLRQGHTLRGLADDPRWLLDSPSSAAWFDAMWAIGWTYRAQQHERAPIRRLQVGEPHAPLAEPHGEQIAHLAPAYEPEQDAVVATVEPVDDEDADGEAVQRPGDPRGELRARQRDEAARDAALRDGGWRRSPAGRG